MVTDGSAWVTLRVYVAGAGIGPKSLLAAFSFQSPEKLGLSAAMAITARAAIRRATFESNFIASILRATRIRPDAQTYADPRPSRLSPCTVSHRPARPCPQCPGESRAFRRQNRE